VLEREVDHAIRAGRRAPQAVEVVEAAAMHLCAGGGEGSGRGIRTSEPDDVVARADELISVPQMSAAVITLDWLGSPAPAARE
jgi:hypothetical protein